MMRISSIFYETGEDPENSDFCANVPRPIPNCARSAEPAFPPPRVRRPIAILGLQLELLHSTTCPRSPHIALIGLSTTCLVSHSVTCLALVQIR